MKRAVPWATVGFAVGIAAGFMWGKTAKSRIGESISTEWNGGVLAVKVDTIKAARSGVPDLLGQYLDRARG